MRNWSLDGVNEEDKKEHIIKCLSDYITEAEAIKDDVTEIHYSEIFDVANLYREIIYLLCKQDQ